MTEQKGAKAGVLPKEHVTVFSSPADRWEEKRWQRHGDGLVFGTIVLTAGILLFLNTLNVLPWNVWDYVWRFWPVILILWGLQIILGSNQVIRWLVNLVGLAIILLVVLFAINEVSPGLLSGLPPNVLQLFTVMKGAR